MVIRNNNGQFAKGNGIKDISGNRYGKLVVIKLDHIRDKRSYWLCRCDCGNDKVVRSDCLKRIQSCGCVKKQQDIINLRINNHHEMTYHRAYRIWNGIMNRCYNPKSHAYKDYGGRGIRVFEAWKNVRVFCQWMDDNKFEDGLSVERIDVNGNYEPENCKLIPRNEQAYNRRDTVYAETDKGRIAVAKEARKNGISKKVAYARVKRGETQYDKIFQK